MLQNVARIAARHRCQRTEKRFTEERDHSVYELLALLQIFLHHPPADRMVEIPILLKRLQSQLPIHLDQLPIQRSHKLHSSDLAQEIRSGLISRLVFGCQRDAKIAGAELDVPGGGQ